MSNFECKTRAVDPKIIKIRPLKSDGAQTEPEAISSHIDSSDPKPKSCYPDTNKQESIPHRFDINKPEPIPKESFPDIVAGKGTPYLLTTIPNIRHLVDTYGITAQFDIFAKKELVSVPGLACAPETADMTALAHITSLASMHRMNIGLVPEFVSAIASERQFNGPLTWIKSKAWDGTDRFAQLNETLVVPDSFPKPLRDMLMKRWIYSLAAAAFMPTGFRARGVLVLQGKQSIGKTTWFLNLLGKESFSSRYLKTGHHLDPSNKDSLLGAASHWLVELGELDSTFKKDAARLKGFLTDNFDKVRLPYARRESQFPRRTVFCGSVNEETYLVDPSGNTRFWTIPVVSIDNSNSIDPQQLFAQALVAVEGGERWWLIPDEEYLLEESNLSFRSVNAIRELILDALDLTVPSHTWQRMNAIEVLYRLGIEKPTNTQCKDAAATLRELEPKIGASTKSQGKVRWNLPLARP